MKYLIILAVISCLVGNVYADNGTWSKRIAQAELRQKRMERTLNLNNRLLQRIAIKLLGYREYEKIIWEGEDENN